MTRRAESSFERDAARMVDSPQIYTALSHPSSRAAVVAKVERDRQILLAGRTLRLDDPMHSLVWTTLLEGTRHLLRDAEESAPTDGEPPDL